MNAIRPCQAPTYENPCETDTPAVQGAGGVQPWPQLAVTYNSCINNAADWLDVLFAMHIVRCQYVCVQATLMNGSRLST